MFVLTRSSLFCDHHFLLCLFLLFCSSFFFFNDTATTEIYTLSLHDALPICRLERALVAFARADAHRRLDRIDEDLAVADVADRKSTRLNSSHITISYAVFCLKKKKNKQKKSYP